MAFAKIYKRYWTELFNAAYKRLPEKYLEAIKIGS
jgi:hypothetical protein